MIPKSTAYALVYNNTIVAKGNAKEMRRLAKYNRKNQWQNDNLKWEVWVTTAAIGSKVHTHIDSQNERKD